ncbi:MAG TPA: TRAP transporter fused permease subunit [Alphaproteobacteria bacterium]|nr:TRAP transporter fused permease subunit [Alphaproteobacteria bacterium]
MATLRESDTTQRGTSQQGDDRKGRIRRVVISALSSSIALLPICWAVQVSYIFGLSFYTEQFLALVLALALGAVFLVHPASKSPNARPHWIDWCLSASGMASCLYLVIRYPRLVDEVADPSLMNIVVSTIVLALVIEGVRRTGGRTLAIMAIGFILFGLYGYLIPGQLSGRNIAYSDLVISLGKDEGVLGRALVIVTTVVVTFIFFGQILFRSGGSNFFTDISMAAMGRYRGGAAKISIVASSLFGAVSGSAVSNVVSTGIITIPLMRKSGFNPSFAAAVEATASTGGQLMPPILGAAAFLMAEFLRVPYSEIVVASILPAILFYSALFIQSDLEASKLNIPRIDPGELPRFRETFAGGWYFPIPFAVLIGGLFWLNWNPETAAIYASATLIVIALFLGYHGKRMTVSSVLTAIQRTGVVSLDIVLIGALAGIIIGVINLSGFGFSLTLILAQLGGSNIVLLLIMAAIICIVLGMGMPTTGVYVLVSVLVAPALVRVGIEPLSAHFFVFYFGMLSMITPPVAIAAYAAASIANTGGVTVALKSVKFAWPAFIVPFLLIGSPSLLMKGTVWEVASAGITAVAGVACVSFGLVGYFRSRLGLLVRAGFALAGLALLVPPSAVAYGLAVNLAGVTIGTALIAHSILSRRLSR